MTDFFALPWLELAVVSCLVGAASVSLRPSRYRLRLALATSGAAFACTFVAWLGFHGDFTPSASVDPLGRWLGTPLFKLDDLTAPLIPAVALLHFLTVLATPRSKMRRFSYTSLFVNEAIRLAAFACHDSTLLIALLALNVVPAYLELRSRGRPTRVFALHMALMLGCLAGGYALSRLHPEAGAAVMMVGVLTRVGVFPLHTWVPDLFEQASFGTALLFTTPLLGVLAAVRLVLPIAPDWVLSALGAASLFTAVYSAALATVQRDARRFFAFVFLSHSSLVLVGLELHSVISLTGAFALWFSIVLSLGSFGLTLRCLEARYGRLALTDFRGLYDQSPTLAVCFLLSGLACVGFPGTLGFVSGELIVDAAIDTNLAVGVAVVLAAALNGIAVLRAYFVLFTGAKHESMLTLTIGLRERVALLTLAALILGGGLYPQPGITTRYTAAEAVTQARAKHFGTPAHE